MPSITAGSHYAWNIYNNLRLPSTVPKFVFFHPKGHVLVTSFDQNGIHPYPLKSFSLISKACCYSSNCTKCARSLSILLNKTTQKRNLSSPPQHPQKSVPVVSYILLSSCFVCLFMFHVDRTLPNVSVFLGAFFCWFQIQPGKKLVCLSYLVNYLYWIIVLYLRYTITVDCSIVLLFGYRFVVAAFVDWQ